MLVNKKILAVVGALLAALIAIQVLIVSETPDHMIRQALKNTSEVESFINEYNESLGILIELQNKTKDVQYVIYPMGELYECGELVIWEYPSGRSRGRVQIGESLISECSDFTDEEKNAIMELRSSPELFRAGSWAILIDPSVVSITYQVRDGRIRGNYTITRIVNAINGEPDRTLLFTEVDGIWYTEISFHYAV